MAEQKYYDINDELINTLRNKYRNKVEEELNTVRVLMEKKMEETEIEEIEIPGSPIRPIKFVARPTPKVDHRKFSQELGNHRSPQAARIPKFPTKSNPSKLSESSNSIGITNLLPESFPVTIRHRRLHSDGTVHLSPSPRRYNSSTLVDITAFKPDDISKLYQSTLEVMSSPNNSDITTKQSITQSQHIRFNSADFRSAPLKPIPISEEFSPLKSPSLAIENTKPAQQDTDSNKSNNVDNEPDNEDNVLI